MASRSPHRMLTVWWANWPIVAAGATRITAIVLAANRVVACSPSAAAAGVAIGQKRRTAQQRCPGAALLDHDPDRDARAFEPVVRAVARFTPRLEMVEPGWLCVESRGPSRYFGGDERLAASIVEAVVGAASPAADDIDACGLGVGIADGRFASAVAARVAAEHESTRTLVVAPATSRAFLAPQPIGWLHQTGEADAELISLFSRLGLHRLETLAELTRAVVADRFGPPGAHAHRLACADDDRPSLAQEPPVERTVEQVLDEPVVQLQPLVFLGKRLADQLVADLALVGLSCTRVVITAETEFGERSERAWYRAAGLSAPAIVERIRWQLEGWVNQPGGLASGVVLLRVVPDEVRHDGGDQLQLWGGLSEADERAVRAVTRLTGLAGEHAVLVPAWQGGRLPADRYQWIPATTADLTESRDDGRSRSRQQHGPYPGSLPIPSPAIVLDEAVPAVVADKEGAPVVVSGRGELDATPATIVLGEREPQEITGWAGPWPVDEWWWDERRHRRLARFQFVTADGTAHLVAVEQQRWWVLASYA